LGFRAVDQNCDSPENPVATKLGPWEPGFTKYHKTTPVASIVKTAINPDKLVPFFYPFISHKAIIPTNIIVIGLKSDVFANTNKIPNPTTGTNHDGIGGFAAPEDIVPSPTLYGLGDTGAFRSGLAV
jgi:hypothetical protein